MTTPKSTRSTWVVSARFHTRISWTTPSTIADTKARVRLVMAPTMAAVRPRRRSSGLSTSVSDEVWPGDARTAVKAESTPAMVHATVEVRRVQTPDRRAESRFSAMARMARPHVDQRTSAARPMATRGATTRVITSPGVKTYEPMRKETSKGTGNGLYRFAGRMNGRAVSTNRTWLSPMVATMTSTRGRSARRRSRSSLSAPTAAAIPRASANENQYSKPKS